MTLDIDAIEARMKDEVAENGDELEFIGIYFSAEEARGLCAEVRELRAANERALRLLERVAAWRSGAVGAKWTAELSADIAALIYPDLPKMAGDK